MLLANNDVVTWSHGGAKFAPASGTPTIEYSPDGGSTWFVLNAIDQVTELSALTRVIDADPATGCKLRCTGGSCFVSVTGAATGPKR